LDPWTEVRILEGQPIHPVRARSGRPAAAGRRGYDAADVAPGSDRDRPSWSAQAGVRRPDQRRLTDSSVPWRGSISQPSRKLTRHRGGGATKFCRAGRPLAIRRATAGDAASVAALWLASFRATYAFPIAHTDDQVERWIRDVVIARQETWVAATRAEAVGLMSLDGEMLDQLYVRPGWTGQGIGSELLRLAKARRPGGLALYTFQVNSGARRFYERHRFVAVSFGDGSGNDEGQPDVRYEWRPMRSGPLG
jgi:GNAT superfamily N-acetyltransferase